LIAHKFSKELTRQIQEGDTIGAKYEYSYRSDMRKRGDDSLLTRSRFMHTNTHDQQSNGFDDNPKRSMDHAEELEALKALITENESTIRLLEVQIQKLEESIKKVSHENPSNHLIYFRILV
jgi:hypothetical protein